MVSIIVNNKLEAIAALRAVNRLKIEGKIIIKSDSLQSISNFIIGIFLFFEILFLFGLSTFKKYKGIIVVHDFNKLFNTINDSSLIIDFVGVNLIASTNFFQVKTDSPINYVGIFGALTGESGTNYKIISKNGINIKSMKLSNSSIMATNSYNHMLKLSTLILKKYFVS